MLWMQLSTAIVASTVPHPYDNWDVMNTRAFPEDYLDESNSTQYPLSVGQVESMEDLVGSVKQCATTWEQTWGDFVDEPPTSAPDNDKFRCCSQKPGYCKAKWDANDWDTRKFEASWGNIYGSLEMNK